MVGTRLSLVLWPIMLLRQIMTESSNCTIVTLPTLSVRSKSVF
jgi:hypothetical protein